MPVSEERRRHQLDAVKTAFSDLKDAACEFSAFGAWSNEDSTASWAYSEFSPVGGLQGSLWRQVGEGSHDV